MNSTKEDQGTAQKTTPTEKYSVRIAIPSYQGIPVIVQNELNRDMETAETWTPEIIARMEGISLISNTRQKMSKDFLNNSKAQFLLFMDADMVIISHNAVDMLLETSWAYNHQAIVAGLFVKRVVPFDPTFRPLLPTDIHEIKRGHMLEKRHVGLAFTLIPRYVFNKVYEFCHGYNRTQSMLPEKFQRYEFPYMPFVYHDKTQGEDGAFCLRAKFAGLKTVIDTRVTIAHLGEYPFTWNDWHKLTGGDPKWKIRK